MKDIPEIGRKKAHLENLDVCETATLKGGFRETECKEVKWIHMAWDGIWKYTIINTTLNFGFQNIWQFIGKVKDY
jgi:hypothetical protein